MSSCAKSQDPVLCIKVPFLADENVNLGCFWPCTANLMDPATSRRMTAVGRLGEKIHMFQIEDRCYRFVKTVHKIKISGANLALHKA